MENKMTRLTLSLLGPFQARLDGEPITDFESAKVRALLAYLAVEAHIQAKPYPRHFVGGLLWPEKSERAALNNLRNALSNLRKTIGDRGPSGKRGPFLQVTRETIRFDPASDHWLDVATFQALVEAGKAEPHPDPRRLQEAVDLYQGDFLQGFSVRDSAEFEQWATFQRERLYRQAIEALDTLAAIYEERGAIHASMACAQRQVELEPWHEGAHRRWMRCLALSGQRGAALAQYATCRQVLADELGIEPAPATTTLYQQILEGAFAPPRPALAPAQGAAAQARFQEAEKGGERPGTPETAAGLPLDRGLDGERRIVTVVRPEIRGKAALADRVGPDVSAEILDHVGRALAAEARQLGGTVSQHSPKGWIACFARHEDDPERAVLAALAMQARFQASLEGMQDKPKLLVTVHTGHVVARETEQAGPEDAAVGETLAVAARVQAGDGSGGAPGSVWVSETTRRLVESLFEWAPRGEIHADHKGKAWRVYRALGRKGDRDKMRGIAGLSSPLIGRDDEFQALQAALAHLQDGVGGIVTLVGEAGIGKSRLVAECKQAALAPGNTPLRWVESRCLSYATHVAYHVWIDALSGVLGLDLDLAPQDAADRVRNGVRRLCGDQADEVHPFLTRMMALPLDAVGEERLRGVEGEGLRALTFRAVETLAVCAAEQSPLVVVCEDLHWADVTSIELLLTLLALTDRVPVLWICVFRPDREHDCWRIQEASSRYYAHRHTHLSLEPLSRGQSSQLIRSLLEIEHLSDGMRARILGRAEGNPFYVEEILRSLIDGGAIAYDPFTRHWETARASSARALPDTLRGVLLARIDRLPRATRQVLQLASVIGRVFSRRVLQALCAPQAIQRAEQVSPLRTEDRGVGDLLDTHLIALQRAQMIVEQSRRPETTYSFKHQLTLEAAYESLPQRKRRALHRRMAEALEDLMAEHLDEQLGLLAHHWEQAGQVDRAIYYLRRAGEQAAAQFANAEAVAYLSRAIKLVSPEDHAARFRLLLAREGVYDVQGARQAQARDLDALEEVAVDDRQRAAIAWRRARCAERTSAHRAAIAAAQEAVHLAQSAQDAESEAHARLYWSQALTYLEERQEARQQCEQAQALARSEQMRPLKATCLHWLGRIAMYSRELEKSTTYYNQALEIWREIGDRRGQAIVLTSLCDTCRRLADYARCRTYGEQALRLLRETGERKEEGTVLTQLGKASYTSGDYGAARDYWTEALPILVETGARSEEAWVREHFGWIARDTGDDAAARDYLEQALPIFREIGEFRSEGRVLTWLGLHHHRIGENQRGLAYIEQALSLGRRTGNLHMQALAFAFQGYILYDLGQVPQATAAFRHSLNLRHGFNTPLVAVYPLFGLAEIALAQGDKEQALEYVDPILKSMASLSVLGGLLEPFALYLTSYRVLVANRQETRAAQLLETAHRLLMERANKIDDQDLQRAYLENVRAHREIVALWQANLAHGSKPEPPIH
jgi:DNA-binding SARP family transcriptional activator/class 3 adenylate cyclase